MTAFQKDRLFGGMLSSLIVFLVGALLTACFAFYVHWSISRDGASRFHRATEQIRSRIDTRLDRYEDMLVQTRAFFVAQPNITRQQFHSYVDALDLLEQYPGIQGLGYTVRIPRERLRAHEARIRASGFPDYRVWPPNPRDEYFSIIFIEPFDWRNQRAFGYDMFTEKIRREAMTRAWDSGQPAITRKVTLVQETAVDVQPGFLIYVPVYEPELPIRTVEERRKALKGFVYSPFRAIDLFKATFSEQSEQELGVDFDVYDGTELSAKSLLYSHGEEAPQGFISQAPPFTRRVSIQMGGHSWTLDFRALPGFVPTYSRYVPIAILATGLLISALLAHLLASARRHAIIERESFLREKRTREEAEEQRRRLYSLFMQAPAQIAVLRGKDLVYELVNPPYQKSVGNRELQGQPLDQALPELEPKVREILREVMRTGKPFVGKEISTALDWDQSGNPSERFFNVVYEPIRDAEGRADGIISFAYEVTEQVQARRRIEGLVVDLQNAVGARDELLSVCGHELRTPVTSMKLQVQSMQRSLRKGDPEALVPARVQRTFERSEAQLNRLSRLIEEMLEFSRIGAGKLKVVPEDCDLREVVQEVVERLEPQALEAGCRIELALPEPLLGRWDRFRLEQVTTNLVTNAIKYGAGKPIHVSAEQSDHLILLHVRDQGLGISREHLARIFEPYERAVSSDNISGLGLGLYISQQIVHAHGGEIRVESEPGRGSVFTVELPKAQQKMA